MLIINQHCHFLTSGGVGFSVEEVVLACHSLQRIAEHVEDTEETGQCFHELIVPRMLSLALQAALQGTQQLMHTEITRHPQYVCHI